MEQLVLGVDYGTDSVRAILVDAYTGKEISSSVFTYPRWNKGLFCDPATNQFSQHPEDYIEGLEFTIKDCIRKAGGDRIASFIRAISVDTTGSTPVAVNEKGIPLSLLPEFAENPNAMFVLWKDHTAIEEAAQINSHAKKFEVNYLKYCGGIYSSEWFWAKLLRVLRTDVAIRQSCYTWIEHCDWIPFLLSGGKSASEIKRSRCAAGHKALWAEEFGGFPPEEFFAGLDPILAGLRSTLSDETFTADVPAGKLCDEWALRLGLKNDVIIGTGAFDAHMGAVGGLIEPYYLSKVMGTSTCDILVAPVSDIGNKTINGICGQVDGSVIPGMIGLEAGQSAFGDTYAWFKDLLLWPVNAILPSLEIVDQGTADKLKEKLGMEIIAELSRRAALLPVNNDSELAIDWLNGRRSPDANQGLEGAISKLSLGSDAPHIFRALVEATCFGAKKIVERFRTEGIQIKGLIGIGGVAKKSPFIMQMMADVLNMPIKIHPVEQTCALGAAMFAAVAGGIYPDIHIAMKAMGRNFELEYTPDTSNAEILARRYEDYISFGNHLEKEFLNSYIS